MKLDAGTLVSMLSTGRCMFHWKTAQLAAAAAAVIDGYDDIMWIK
jgi:hypothetical protein